MAESLAQRTFPRDFLLADDTWSSSTLRLTFFGDDGTTHRFFGTADTGAGCSIMSSDVAETVPGKLNLGTPRLYGTTGLDCELHLHPSIPILGWKWTNLMVNDHPRIFRELFFVVENVHWRGGIIIGPDCLRHLRQMLADPSPRPFSVLSDIGQPPAMQSRAGAKDMDEYSSNPQRGNSKELLISSTRPNDFEGGSIDTDLDLNTSSSSQTHVDINKFSLDLARADEKETELREPVTYRVLSSSSEKADHPGASAELPSQHRFSTALSSALSPRMASDEEEPDSDAESAISEVFSVITRGTAATDPEDLTTDEVIQAADELCFFFAFDDFLRKHFKLIFQDSLMSGEDFEEALRKQLRGFARNLRNNGKDKEMQLVGNFIRRKAKITASKVRQIYDVSDADVPRTEEPRIAVTANNDLLDAPDDLRAGSDPEDEDESREVDSENVEEAKFTDQFFHIRGVLLDSTAMKELRDNFQKLVDKNKFSWNRCSEKWPAELSYMMPRELEVDFTVVEEPGSVSLKDRLQMWFENFTGGRWVWYPLKPPVKPLATSKVRIEWKCVSK